MITFLFCVKKRNIQPTFLENFKLLEDVSVIFVGEQSNLSLKNLKPNKNIACNVFYFADGTSQEDMIQSVISKVYCHTLVLVRDDESEVDFNILNSMIKKQREGYDVVLARPAKRNPIKNFFVKLMQKLVNYVFNFKLFDGDLTYQIFGGNAVSILKANGTALLTKVDKWLGAKIGYVEYNHSVVQTDKNRKSLKLLSIIYSLVLGLTLGTSITLGVILPLPWLALLGLVFANMISFILFAYYILRLYISLKVGELAGKQVAIIDNVEVI